MTADWKQVHADASDDAVNHPIVQAAIAELMDNLGLESGLVNYGMSKIASYAAQVARAQAQGFDPELLRLTPDEANSALLHLAAEAVLRGVPTYIVDLEEQT